MGVADCRTQLLRKDLAPVPPAVLRYKSPVCRTPHPAVRCRCSLPILPHRAVCPHFISQAEDCTTLGQVFGYVHAGLSLDQHLRDTALHCCTGTFARPVEYPIRQDITHLSPGDSRACWDAALPLTSACSNPIVMVRRCFTSFSSDFPTVFRQLIRKNMPPPGPQRKQSSCTAKPCHGRDGFGSDRISSRPAGLQSCDAVSRLSCHTRMLYKSSSSGPPAL